MNRGTAGTIQNSRPGSAPHWIRTDLLIVAHSQRGGAGDMTFAELGLVQRLRTRLEAIAWLRPEEDGTGGSCARAMRWDAVSPPATSVLRRGYNR